MSSKQVRRLKFNGSLLVFVITVFLLFPAIYTTFTYRTIDESCFQSLIRYLFRNLGQGKLCGISLLKEFGAPYAYGWIYWVVAGIPAKILELGGMEELGIFWPRFLSTISYAISLAILWKAMYRAKLPCIVRIGSIIMIGFTPSLVYNAIRMHPDIILFLTLIVSYCFLMEDECNIGSNFYIGVLFWGISIGIKLSGVFCGLGIFSYLLYSYTQNKNITSTKLKQIIIKSTLIVVIGLIITNPTLLLPRHFKDHIDFLKYLSVNNSDTVAPGLSWATWFRSLDKFFIWLPFFFSIVTIGFISAYSDYKNKSLRPYALVGLAGFWGSFWATALLVLKTPSWHHYLLPAYSAFPFIVIGSLLWLVKKLNARFYWVILVIFIAFTSTQIRVTHHMWYMYAVKSENPLHLYREREKVRKAKENKSTTSRVI